jgi:hypothetical protein
MLVLNQEKLTMATKAKIIAGLRKYDFVDKGWARKNLTGDNPQIEYLRAILTLPHIQALSDDAEISFSSFLGELIRLDIDPETIYTTKFMTGISASSILFQHLFPESAHPLIITAQHAPTPDTPPKTAPYDQSDIAKSMKIIRDKLLVYISCVCNQPSIASFFGGLIGKSGFAGLERAKKYLSTVNRALANYNHTSTISPAINEPAHLANFGSHTHEILMPSLKERMTIIMSLLHFTSAKFTTIEYDTISDDENIKGIKTNIHLSISTPSSQKIQGTFECDLTRDKFETYLEKYLERTNFSFTERHALPADFFEDFQGHLDSLVREESLSRRSKAAAVIESRANANAHLL